MGEPFTLMQSNPDRVTSVRTIMADAYTSLRRDILNCTLEPGARVRFEDLKQAYGLGLSPLREALMRLAAEGLVVLEQHKGFRIAPVSREDLLDIIRMRRDLDCIGVEQSIANADDAWEADLLGALHQLRKLPKPIGVEGDDAAWERWEDRHRHFHAALLARCQSAWLFRFRDALYDQLARYKTLSDHYLGAQRDDLAEHEAIAKAALARDVASAKALLCDHIDRTAAALMAASNPKIP